MELTKRRQQLFEFVALCHQDQARKYTGDPYHVHLAGVVDILQKYGINGVEIEIAMCHDLFEDTKCSYPELKNKLVQIGYQEAAQYICVETIALTDKFDKKFYPEYNRKQRKQMEAVRLGAASGIAQTVKFADIIENMTDIQKHDKGFAKVFAEEAMMELEQMQKGNEVLRSLVAEICEEILK
jgi:(p)ppGpp synthase/HD superfamily hydrolase